LAKAQGGHPLTNGALFSAAGPKFKSTGSSGKSLVKLRNKKDHQNIVCRAMCEQKHQKALSKIAGLLESMIPSGEIAASTEGPQYSPRFKFSTHIPAESLGTKMAGRECHKQRLHRQKLLSAA